MKILLIAPYVNLNVDNNMNRDDFYPSAALLHLASILRMNNYEPIIVDLNNSVVHEQKEKYMDYCNAIIKDSLEKHKPDLVGINCLFSGVFPDVLQFAKTVKSYSKELIKKKLTLPLCGDIYISFNKIELFIRKNNKVKSKILNIKNINKLPISIKNKINHNINKKIKKKK